MRTDVKIGLLCVFVVILGSVIYFAVVPGQRRPAAALGGSVPASADSSSTGNGLATPKSGGTLGGTPAVAPGAGGGLQIASPGASPTAASDSHSMDIAPGSSGPIGQQLAQATPPGGGMSGGMIAPPPSPSSAIMPTQGTGLASPPPPQQPLLVHYPAHRRWRDDERPAPQRWFADFPQPRQNPDSFITPPLLRLERTTLLGGSGGSLETSHRDVPTPGGSDMGGSSHYGGMSRGNSSFGGPSLLGSGSTGTTHAVEKGDTFGILAKKYGVTIQAIAAANPGVQSNNLKIGKVLNIPAASSSSSSSPSITSTNHTPPPATKPAASHTLHHAGGTVAESAHSSPGTGKPGSTYTVKKGDTLDKIAETVYGDKSAWKKIYEANHEQIADANVVTVGQVLKLP